MMIGYALSILMMLSVLHGGPNSPQTENTTMKLFLSYCHQDKKHLKAFRKHITLLKQKGAITDWHDREIPVGGHIAQEIKKHLGSADIIALFISADFLDSDNCRKELEAALSLKEQNKADIMPIIVSPCDWKNSDLEKFKACPDDGKAVEDWKSAARAWVNVTDHLKHLLRCLAIKKKELTKNHRDSMENPGDFVSSNRKEILRLQDFYTYPKLERQHRDGDDDKILMNQKDAEFLTKLDSIAGKAILVLGDDLSGKTALCKIICGKLMESSYVPLYIHGEDIANANIQQIEKLAFEKQYEHLHSDSVSNEQKIIIMDNFAGEKITEHRLHDLLNNIKNQGYHAVILMASTMNPLFETPKWDKSASKNDVTTYHIVPVGHHERMKIIQKWVTATHKDKDISGREQLEEQYFEFVNLMFTDNTIPPYPPYIIMVLEAKTGSSGLASNMAEDMSSYGKCYNALITHALISKANIAPGDIGKYHTILREFAYFMYDNDKTVATEGDWREFVAQYQEKYILDDENFKAQLIKSGILTEDLMGIGMLEHASYYFIAEKLSHDFDSDKLRKQTQREISSIFSGVHRKRNGHILLFLVNHMPKNEYLLKKLNKEMDSLFGQFSEAKLTTEEMMPLHQFLDHLPIIEMEANVSESRRQELRDGHVHATKTRDESDGEISRRVEEDSDNIALINIGKSLRMMKIAGSLLKNERGSIEKRFLAELSASTRGISLRILSFVHKTMAKHSDLFSLYLDKVMDKNIHDWKNLDQHEKRDTLRKLMGMWVIAYAHHMIERCAWCIGSEKLTALINQQGDDDLCPSYQLIHLATSMWYDKKIDKNEVEALYKKWKKSNITGARLLQHLVVNHMHMHKMPRQQQQQFAEILDLNIKSQNLIEFKRAKNAAALPLQTKQQNQGTLRPLPPSTPKTR